MSVREWLEADGTGGFASGTADLVRTRRYHALLLTQTRAGRFVLVNGLEASITLPSGDVPISAQLYAPGVQHPDGASRVAAFTADPWPRWSFRLPDGSMLVQEIFVAGGQTCLRWARDGTGPAVLNVRLLLSGRDYHALHHENPAFRFAAEEGPGKVVFPPYPGLAQAVGHFEPRRATWRADPLWFRRFLYSEEAARGLDCEEDLASPGILSWPLDRPATLALRADGEAPADVGALAATERARRRSLAPLQRAAEQYMAALPHGSSVIAGYPWFTDWGRDTFIALRGLLLATGRVRMAEEILLAWAGHVDGGMLPNRFPDGVGAPEYNAVDASLWFVVAVHDLLTVCVGRDTAARLQAACAAILDGYAAGVRFGIRMDSDGLLLAGAPGVQLTWMDAKVGDWVVTPRRGKPIEVQALWINALRIAGGWPGGERFASIAANATASVLARFPDPSTGGLRDTVDGDAVEGDRVRPNQILAVGGLPHGILPGGLARGVVDLVATRLLTPLGLRTLDPADPAYRGRYAGGVLERDGAYHQGTAWPWLLGPFVQAWLRVGGAREAGRARFLPPLQAHLAEAGLGHVSEVVDGDAPHAPGGCPFQAWSLGEMLRIEAMLA